PACAQQPLPSRSEAIQRLDAQRNSLTEAEQRESALKDDVAKMRADQERLTQQLLETAQRVQKSEAQMTLIESRRGELEAQEKRARASLAERRDQIAKLLAAMQRMGRNPPPVIVTQREDALAMVRSAMLLARAFPKLKSEAEELSGKLNDLIRVMAEIRSESERLRSEKERYQEAKAWLASLMESKRRTLAERQRELEEVRRVATAISKSVSDLSDLITRLDRTVAEKTGLGDYEAEMRKQSAEAAEPKSDGGEGAGAPASSGETKVAAVPRAPGPAVALEPQGPLTGNPGRMKPAIPFHLAKARLPLPAQGKRVIAYGDKTQYGSTSKGIVIETRHGAQITAPCDGWVVYAGEFRSYGQLLIINAGDGYHVLLAGLSHIDVQVGQFVLAAEPVGTMAPEPPGKTQDSAPVLYVEFRKEGRPIDPDPWWFEGSQKVQG
ncbi:MAG TPA: peptidoglycan DD-metalloendopeptidase family protein, partial [Hyphomicrobiaceae bacterium]|nr:peptidoglycan DD-metalloendopeptidase family protein [Hyphomicrobiaceae bacterium]